MFLCLGVVLGGCIGFLYVMGFDDKEFDEDIYMDIYDMKVVVEKENLKYLNGFEIDFEEFGMFGGFIIYNFNVVVICGCGFFFCMREEVGVLDKDC